MSQESQDLARLLQERAAAERKARQELLERQAAEREARKNR